MNLSILKAFIADQREAKAIVSEKLNVPEDLRAYEWATRFSEIRAAYHARPFADIFKPHGYGLELKIGDLSIDYDYSESGRADGFDAWRIFTYITAGEFDCNGPDDLISERVDRWFEKLLSAGKIYRADNLFYLNPPLIDASP